MTKTQDLIYIGLALGAYIYQEPSMPNVKSVCKSAINYEKKTTMISVAISTYYGPYYPYRSGKIEARTVLGYGCSTLARHQGLALP
jgi:hypothetical protein